MSALGRIVRSLWPRRLRAAARVGDRVLVLVGNFPRVGPGHVEATAIRGGRIDLEARCVTEGRRKVLLLGFPAGAEVPEAAPRIELRAGDWISTIEPHDLERAVVDLGFLVRKHLLRLDRAKRAEVLALARELSLPHLDGGGGFSLGKDLRTLRDALRTPLPSPLHDRDEAQLVGVDRFFAIDERSFVIEGWTLDEDGTFDRLTAVSPEGQEADLGDAFRYTRPDIVEKLESTVRQPVRHGFMKYFELPAPSLLDEGWLLQWQDARGSGVEEAVPAPRRDAAHVQAALLGTFAKEQPNREELRSTVLHPALVKLQVRHRASVGIDGVVDYGAVSATPDVSIVVTLYRRIDFLYHQVLHFARDPAMHQAELIYVLDSPEDNDALQKLAAEAHALHGLPFRVATLSRNAGFPVANILGASLARGRLLLLLNSDVLPDQPGWLDRMVRFYDATPDIGVLGAKLLFEDESIQHAGMYFERDPVSRNWENLHYFKGLHRDFPAAAVSRPVPAITGGLLMIDRALYDDVGGLRQDYILQGGYEDSDLCLRLIDRGLRNWYVADAELYHLEGQAHESSSRVTTKGYNIWLHTHLWDRLMERVMSEAPAAGPPAPPGAEGNGGPPSHEQPVTAQGLDPV